ncbi:hypothetical protein TrVE_jg13148 [Triparma verrucosa]|uniref:Tyrosine-protein kinase ephrin type A/B receptor-like domain-containing protein n=1 Tax=Triparma verrucosa TaxID=1606542 RepID=A0A9W7BPE3_9STRA|nr:hypothetical protein TrVE_jg13148 [Triparma verrucosa]
MKWSTVLCLLSLLFLSSTATEEMCQKDCSMAPTLRMLGPTRPSDAKDDVGNDLYLTRPHPYSQAPMEAAVVRFNSTVQLDLPAWNVTAGHSFGTFHKNYLLRSLRVIAREFVSDDLKILSTTAVQESTPGDATTSYVQITYLSEYVVDFTAPYNHSTTDDFVAVVLDRFESSAAMLNVTGTLQNQAALSPSEPVKTSLVGAGVSLPAGYTRPTLGNGQLVEFMRLQTPNPNPFAEFCMTGCTFFFSLEATTSKPAYLSECMAQCDYTYRSAEHITIRYSDLAEAARLECRDGCQIALARCQPGYRCTQVEMTMSGGIESWSDGLMSICPPGTYRDVDYDNVEQCVDCPQGRYREDEKGRYMESCAQCPIGRYVNVTGSSSILKCNRCPAGRFGKFPGLALCACINDKACLDPPEFVSPADAEKRQMFPFEGRW